MDNSSWKYTLWRAARTFVQTALGYIVTALGGGLAGIVDADGHIIRTAVVGLIISAIAAGLAALMNLPREDLTAGVERVTVNMGVTSIDELPIAGQDGTDEEAGDGDE